MDNSSLNATEIAVGSLLANNNRGGGYGGGGGGAWGGGYGGGGYGPFAGPSSNAVRINRNTHAIDREADCTRNILGKGLDQIVSSFEEAARDNQFAAIRDGQFQAELRGSDRLRDLQAQITDNAAASAKCCCDLKAEIVGVEARTISRELDAANAKITQLETINALKPQHHGHHHVGNGGE